MYTQYVKENLNNILFLPPIILPTHILKGHNMSGEKKLHKVKAENRDEGIIGGYDIETQAQAEK